MSPLQFYHNQISHCSRYDQTIYMVKAIANDNRLTWQQKALLNNAIMDKQEVIYSKAPLKQIVCR